MRTLLCNKLLMYELNYCIIIIKSETLDKLDNYVPPHTPDCVQRSDFVTFLTFN